MTGKTIRMKTETVQEAIKQYVKQRGENRFTTYDIARYMGAEEYPVRAAIRWLHEYKEIDVIPGVRSCRYTKTLGDKYSTAIYRLRMNGQCDIKTLMLALCR